jgi:hypothetical protein
MGDVVATDWSIGKFGQWGATAALARRGRLLLSIEYYVTLTLKSS